MIHDFYDLIWSGIELSNDPATTVAFAEVAAYLCHALEMEDSAIHALAKKREEINQTAAQNRHDRDHYQTATYQESYVFADPNATVEEVILSAFGGIQKSVEEAKLASVEAENDIPGSVVLGSDDGDGDGDESQAVTPNPDADATTVPQVAPDKAVLEGYEDILPKPTGIDSNDIDVQFLREKITQKAEATKKEQQQIRTSLASIDPKKLDAIRQYALITDENDNGKEDIEELARLARANEASKQRKPNPLEFEKADESPDAKNPNVNQNDITIPTITDRPDRSKPLEGEAPVAHFYRVLDQVLKDQRLKAAELVAAKTGAVNKETEHELGPHELKQHIQSHRSEKRSRKPHMKSGVHPAIEQFIKKNPIGVCAVVLGSLLLGLIFCVFGCYGIYMFVFPPSLGHVAVGAAESHAFSGSEIRLPLVIQEGKRSQNGNEYVIRVVREVVHVDANGKTLRTESHNEL